MNCRMWNSCLADVDHIDLIHVTRTPEATCSRGTILIWGWLFVGGKIKPYWIWSILVLCSWTIFEKCLYCWKEGEWNTIVEYIYLLCMKNLWSVKCWEVILITYCHHLTDSWCCSFHDLSIACVKQPIVDWSSRWCESLVRISPYLEFRCADYSFVNYLRSSIMFIKRWRIRACDRQV